MSPVHGGILAARALKQAGVECIFTLCGGHIMPLYDGLHRAGHPHHRRPPRAGRRPRGRCLGALQPGQGRRRRHHRRSRRHGRRHRHRERLARQLADPGVRRPGALREPAPRLAPGDGPHRRGAADHQVRRRHLPDAPHPRVRRAGHPPRGVGHSRARPTSRSPWTSSWAASRTTRSTSRASARAPPRLSPDREAVREALSLLTGARRPMLMAGTSVKWSQASRGDEPLHLRDAHPQLHERHGPRDDPAGLARVPEPLAARGAEADRLHHARRHPARLPHGASARRSRPTRRSSSSTWTRP